MAGLIDTNVVIQIAFVVKDIVKTKNKLADFFGVEPPEHFETERGPANIVKGESNPNVNAYLAFFRTTPGVSIELIQPLPAGKSSVWQDVLDEHGEGFHHIAFRIEGMDDKVLKCEGMGWECLQRGKGYAYMDARKDLSFIIELLGE